VAGAGVVLGVAWSFLWKRSRNFARKPEPECRCQNDSLAAAGACAGWFWLQLQLGPAIVGAAIGSAPASKPIASSNTPFMRLILGASVSFPLARDMFGRDGTLLRPSRLKIAIAKAALVCLSALFQLFGKSLPAGPAVRRRS
jgi:hypothetical protein